MKKQLLIKITNLVVFLCSNKFVYREKLPFDVDRLPKSTFAVSCISVDAEKKFESCGIIIVNPITII